MEILSPKMANNLKLFYHESQMEFGDDFVILILTKFVRKVKTSIVL